jgi:hypothetical protein
VDAARFSLKHQRLAQTAVRSNSACLLVDTKTYLQSMTDSSASRVSVSAEIFRQFDDLKARTAELLEYSKYRQSRLFSKVSLLQTEIEVLP